MLGISETLTRECEGEYEEAESTRIFWWCFPKNVVTHLCD